MYKVLVPLRVLVCVVVLFSTMIVLAQSDAEETDTPSLAEYTVITDTGNLRATASTSAAIVGRVVRNESLLVYDEESATEGWLRVYREDEDDAYIADFLVERAPQRFYDPAQEPFIVISGRGVKTTDRVEFPQGFYRIDALVEDNSFILGSITSGRGCEDAILFNALNFDTRRLTISTLFITGDCRVAFATDSVDGNWTLEFRELFDMNMDSSQPLFIEDGTAISGDGPQLTMPTILDSGEWEIEAWANGAIFSVDALVLDGSCRTVRVIEEEARFSTVSATESYRVPDLCILYWHINLLLGGTWELTFTKLR